MKKNYIQPIIGACALLFIGALLFYRPSIYAGDSVTILEIMVVASDDPTFIIDEHNLNSYLHDGKIVGSPFSTQHYPKCYLLARYNPTRSKMELKAALQEIQHAMA